MRFFGGNKAKKQVGQPPSQASVATPQQEEPSQQQQQQHRLVLGSPKDKYGVSGLEETEIPSPAYYGVPAQAGGTVMVDAGKNAQTDNTAQKQKKNEAAAATEGGTSNVLDEDLMKKKKKKRKKIKKKKKISASTEDGAEDMPIVVDRVPTAVEYESDDSIERMIDERSRYSRYTTEYDELDLETFEDGEETEEENDKYANGLAGKIISTLSNDSSPPVWRSWDDEEEKKKKIEERKAYEERRKKNQEANSTTKRKENRRIGSRDLVERSVSNTEASRKSQGSAAALSALEIQNKPSTMSKKSKGSGKYQDLRQFRKSHCTDKNNKVPSQVVNQNPEEEAYSSYILPDFNSPMSAAVANGISEQHTKRESEENGAVKESEVNKAEYNKASQEKSIARQNSKESGGSHKGGLASQGSMGSSNSRRQVPLANTEEWIAYNTFSGTFEKSKESKASIPPIVSDTSSLTDPLRKHEKYTALMMTEQNKDLDKKGPPREIIPGLKPPTHPGNVDVSKDLVRDKSLITWSTSKDTTSISGTQSSPAKGGHPLASSTFDENRTRERYHDQSPVSAGVHAASSGGPNGKQDDEYYADTTVSSSVQNSSKGARRDRYTEIERLHSTSTEARTNRSSKSAGPKPNYSDKKEPMSKGSPKLNQRNDIMYSKSLVTEEGSDASSIPMSPAERTKRGQMKELDEYSVAISVQDDPALVQCLRFYQCAAAASIANLTFSATRCLPSTITTKNEVQMLARGPDLDEVDKMRYRENHVKELDEDHGSSRSRQHPISPKIEVILEQNNNDEDDDDDDSSLDGSEHRDDDSTVDAPDLKAVVPNAHSYLREVTSLSLHLDGEILEEKTQKPAIDRGRAMAKEAETDLYIREIVIPRSSSTKIQKRFAKEHNEKRTGLLEIQDTVSEQENIRIIEAKMREVEMTPTDDVEERQNSAEGTGGKEYSPEIEIIDKNSSEESSRPTSSKKRLSKLFSRFGRKAKTMSSGSGNIATE